MMKLAYSSKRFGGFLLAFFLLFGIITVASSTAQAQVPWWDRDRREEKDVAKIDLNADRVFRSLASRATDTG